MDSNDIFINNDSFKSSKLDYEQLLLKQIDRIAKAGSKEFGRGMFDINRVTGETMYLDSPEEEYMNGIIQLDILITPYTDELYNNKIKEYNKEFEIKLNEHNKLIEDETLNKDKKINIISNFKGYKIDYYSKIYKEEIKMIDRMGQLLGGRDINEVLE